MILSESDAVKERPIFVCHPSALLTDHLPNGDGLIAHGFLSSLAERGYDLHVAVDQVALKTQLPPNVHLYRLGLRSKSPALRLLEYAVRMRALFSRLRKSHSFALAVQMNPVFPGLSLGMVGSGVPLILGTYVPRWPSSPAATTDGYGTAQGTAAKIRDFVVGLQQAHADALLLTTKAAENRVPWLSRESTKIFLVAHGIDTGLFRPADNDLKAPKSKKILFLGSITARKGIFDLLSAFKRVAEVVPDSQLTIVGPGDDLEKAKSMIASHRYRERISMTGKISRLETAVLYQECTVFCLPSYGEPYATSLLEAMSSGMPIVSTNTGGTPYLVPAGGGRLITPGDVDGLAAALTEVLSSEALRRSMSEVNRKTCVETYSWGFVIDRLEDVYFTVTDGAVGKRLPTRSNADPVA